MESAFDALIIVGGSVVCSIVGMMLVRKNFKAYDFTEHHEVAGYLLSVVGTLYAVLLGLIVVNVQGKYDQARVMAETEANSCSDIWQLSRGFPEPIRHDIRICLRDYYTVVQSEDWDKIGRGLVHEQSIPQYQKLWKTISEFQPADNRANACYSSTLTSMAQLSDARRYRLSAFKRGISPIVWLVLAIGGTLTILFTYFFAIRNTKTQATLIVFVALFLSLNVFLVRMFDHPYREELHIKRTAFSLKPSVLDDTPPGNQPVKSDVEIHPQQETSYPVQN